jgi:aryl-alcohol dehydrogenase-like predicted oxidoreductase
MRYRKLGNSDLAVSEISLGSWLTFAGGVAAEQVHANARASGVELTTDVLAAIDAALGAAPVKAPTLALLAQEGVLHR